MSTGSSSGFPSAGPEPERPTASTMSPSINVPSLNPEALSFERGTADKPISISSTSSSPAKTSAVSTESHFGRLEETPTPKVSQEPSLQTVLGTLTLLKSDVASLTIWLRSTEDRVARLENEKFERTRSETGASLETEHLATPRPETSSQTKSDFLALSTWCRSTEHRLLKLEQARIDDDLISSLTKSLRKAENRIAALEEKEESRSAIANLTTRITQLEAAQGVVTRPNPPSWTPLGSPVLPSSENDKAQEEKRAAEIENSKTTTSTHPAQNSTPKPCSCKSAHPPAASPPPSPNTSIQAHLKPLVDGINAIASHLALIDTRLSHLSPTPRSTIPSPSTSTPPKPESDWIEVNPSPSPSSTTSPPPPHAEPESQPPNNPKEKQHHTAPTPLVKLHQSFKFGEPSTPNSNSRPLARLNLAASPFAKYGEQTSSPFARLAESARQTGAAQSCFSCTGGCGRCRPGRTGDGAGTEAQKAERG